jgi:hypothetical protein
MSLLDGMTALQVTVMKDHHKPCSLSVGIGVCGNLLKKKNTNNLVYYQNNISHVKLKIKRL